MPLYGYRCPACGRQIEREASIERGGGDCVRCPCGASARRSFSFRVGASFQDHYNPAVGGHVTNRRTFGDGLKRASEAATLNTGIDHTYEPVEGGDHEAVGLSKDDVAAAKERYKKAASEGDVGAQKVVAGL